MAQKRRLDDDWKQKEILAHQISLGLVMAKNDTKGL
jgi:hypothetical protein